MVKIKSNNPKLTLVDLENFEKENFIAFPNEYKYFLHEYNGGHPDKSLFKIKSNFEEYENVLNVFYGIGTKYAKLENIINYLDELIEIGFLPIANDPGGNQICIGISNEFYQKIYFWDHETEIKLENLQFVSDSFLEFLNDLTE